MLLDFIIGKYPNSCFASDLLRHQVDIFPKETYIGCKELFPNVSQFVASEYNIIESNLLPIGNDFSVFLYQFPLFCSLYILSLLF